MTAPKKKPSSPNTNVWERKWKPDSRHPARTIPRELPNEFSRVAIADMKRRQVRKVLELGAGAGRDTAAFVENGFDVTAVEISKSGATRLKNDFPAALIINGDIREVKLSPQSTVDAIYAFSVLHYFTDAEINKIYKNLTPHLKEGGRLYIAMRSVNDEMYGKGKKVGKNTYEFNDAVRRFFTPKTMVAQVSKNGFEVVSMSDRTVQYHAHDGDHKSTFIEVIAQKKVQPKKSSLRKFLTNLFKI